MCSEAANSDCGSKDVKERRSRPTSTVYTVDTTQKTSMNGLAVSYSDDQSPLSTLKNTGRQKNAAAAAAAWRHSSALQTDVHSVQTDVHGRSSQLHGAAANRRPASNQCLRRSETASPAEVITGCIYRNQVLVHVVCCGNTCSCGHSWSILVSV